MVEVGDECEVEWVVEGDEVYDDEVEAIDDLEDKII